MSKLILVMGLPGSGKTTFSSSSLKGTRLHVDEIRKALTGTYKPGSANELVYGVVQRSLDYYLQKEKTVIVDGAFLSRKSRHPYLQLAKKRGAKIEVYWLDPSFSLFKKRIVERNKVVDYDRKIDLQYMNKLLETLDMPTKDEGIDTIIRLTDNDFS
jgi:predicted kinase